MMKLTMKAFTSDVDGAVTVDWLVLTAAVIGLTLSAIAALSPSLMTRGEEIVAPVSIQTNF